MNRRATDQPTAPERDTEAGEVQVWLDYFGHLTPRQLIVHMYAARAAADTDLNPECQEGATLTLAILRLFLTLDRERGAA